MLFFFVLFVPRNVLSDPSGKHCLFRIKFATFTLSVKVICCKRKVFQFVTDKYDNTSFEASRI